MINFSKEEFVSLLTTRKTEYTPRRAERIYDQLSNSDQDIQLAVLQWIESDVEPVLKQIEGWSVSRLKSEFGMNTLAVILTLDWLRKEPQQALAALKDGIK